MQSPQSDQNSKILNELEISLQDIFYFVQKSWKRLAVAAAMGAILGFSYWNFLGVYSARVVLLNNNNTLDLVSWKILQKSLPDLTSQILEDKELPIEQYSIYRSMTKDIWWQSNINPIFALSKEDVKRLASVGKDLDGASTSIVGFTLDVHDIDKSVASKKALYAINFIRSGGSYLQLRSLLGKYRSQAINQDAEVRQKISKIKVDIAYLELRAKNLEDLHKRFPGTPNMNAHVVNLNDSNAKYLSLITQIIAANAEISNLKEEQNRLEVELKKLSLIKKFLDQATPLQDLSFDGLVLVEQYLNILRNLSGSLTKENSYSGDYFSQLYIELIAVDDRFKRGLEVNASPIVIKKGFTRFTAGGLAGGFFLMLLILLGERIFRQYQCDVKK